MKFYMYIINKESITWCLKNSFNNLNIVGTLKCLVTGNTANINSLCQHLWYIFAYIKIIIWIPILWLVCKEEKTSKLARRIIIAFGILSSIVTDAQRFVILPKIGAMEVFELVDREILYVLFGYELFVHKDKLKNKKVFLLSTIGFFIINFVRYKIESKYMSINSFTDIVGRENFIDWRYTSLSIISGILLFTGVYAFEIKSKIFEKIILWLSDKTFGVYLIHYLIFLIYFVMLLLLMNLNSLVNSVLRYMRESQLSIISYQVLQGSFYLVKISAMRLLANPSP